MTKKELVNVMAEKLGITKKDTAVYVDTVFETIIDTLANGEEISINGFGNFKLKEVAARTCRNPKTGEAVEVPAHGAMSFSASKALKEAVR